MKYYSCQLFIEFYESGTLWKVAGRGVTFICNVYSWQIFRAKIKWIIMCLPMRLTDLFKHCKQPHNQFCFLNRIFVKFGCIFSKKQQLIKLIEMIWITLWKCICLDVILRLTCFLIWKIYLLKLPNISNIHY